ncbi:MAG TPA: PIN domain-containing protein [Rhodopila sp.]|nr:PIN domain-containing protein [Rhodopila sp.]
MRLVLDTDVIRSGLQSARGASRLLLCAIAEGGFTSLITVATVLEHEDVLLRPESLAATGLTPIETSDFLDAYVASSERVIVRRTIRPSIRDPSAEISVEALLNGHGDAIVSFNRRDYLDAEPRLASQGRPVVPVLSPGEAPRSLSWRPTATTRFAFPHP